MSTAKGRPGSNLRSRSLARPRPSRTPARHKSHSCERRGEGSRRIRSPSHYERGRPGHIEGSSSSARGRPGHGGRPSSLGRGRPEHRGGSSSRRSNSLARRSSRKLHSSHPKCPLSVSPGGMYTCNGCKMDGIGQRYRCDQHDFDLHEECISALPKMNAFHKYRCEFLKQTLSTSAYCEACGFPAKGFVYHCAKDKKNLYFHPRCALLRTEIPLNDTKFKLRQTAPSNCHWCNKERVTGANKRIPGWAYISELGSGFHVYCVFEMAMQMRKNTKASGGGIIDNKWAGKIGIAVLKVLVSTLLGPLGGVVHLVDLF